MILESQDPLSAEDRTAEILRGVTGGTALLVWMGGIPNFGDAEVRRLMLDRSGESTITIEAMTRVRGRHEVALVTFVLADEITLQIEGFSYQNVIEGLELRRLDNPAVTSSAVGTRVVPGDVEIVLSPCFGAHGLIRARLREIRIEPISPHA